MTDRVHEFLDGELPRESLTTAELAEALALQAVMEQSVAVLRGVPVPDLTDRIMAGLPAAVGPATEGEPAPGRVLSWLWRPRELTLRYRPAYLAAAAAIAAAIALVVPTGAPELRSPPVVSTAAGSPRLYVQFRLEAPAASDVRLAGSFTGWAPTLRLREVAPGVWTALVPLEPGVHDYNFLVDGKRWVADPYAPNVEDSFGGSNSRLFLPSPRASA